jgi:hypothetical protein
MKILLSLIALCGQLQANDMSYLNISAGTGDTPTKVHFIVADSLGRKTGFESFYYGENGYIGVNTYDEIPHSGYLTEATGSLDPSVVPNEPESTSFGINGPIIRDTYTITVLGYGDTKYFLDMALSNEAGKVSTISNNTYITSGTAQQYSIYIDPSPGAPTPIITKTITFNLIRQDLSVALKLGQIGDAKFVESLTRLVNLGERMNGACKKDIKHKDKSCQPAISVLNMVVKRLEKANRKCDSKEPRACDEDKDWDDFGKEHRKDHDYDEFFRDWDRDDWHKDKKKCKRFVSDEALKIIKEDAQWLIKSLGGQAEDDRNKPGHGKHD